jgi:amino acid adenylation domain-containing protein
VKNLLTNIENRAKNDGHHAYGDGRQRSLSYHELQLQLARYRTHLNDLGLSGKRVGVLMPDAYSLGLAVLACGGLCWAAPLDSSLPPGVLKTRAELLELDAVLVGQGQPCPVGIGVACHELSNGASASPWRDHDCGLLLTTSGSSGEVKPVGLRMSHLDAATTAIVDGLALGPEDRCWGIMPLFHIHGLSALLATLTSGGTFLATGLPSADVVEASLSTLRPTWYTCSPTLHSLILQSCGSALSHDLRFVRSASGPAPLELIRRVEQALKVPFIEAYGMTEAAPFISSNGLAQHERKAGSVGRPSGPQVKVVEGEIHIKGDNVASVGWLATGDLGHFDEDGFLFVTGRKSDIINRGGEKIRPREIEEAVLTHPAVSKAAAFAVADEVWGHTVGLALVPHGPTDVLDDQDRAELEAHLRGFLGRRLAPSHIPQGIVFLDQLPATPSGKLLRRALRPRNSESNVLPSVESLIAGLWAQVLGLENVRPEDNFFQQGGNSLTALSLLHRIEKETGCRIGLAQLLKNPSLESLTEVLRNYQFSIELSQAQQRIWIACQETQLASLYNVSASLELEGSLDLDVLNEAVNALFKSLPNLWVRCRPTDDGPRFFQIEEEDVRLEAEPFSAMRFEQELRTAFDLTNGPMFRVCLLKRSESEHVLILLLHHLVADGWSAELVRIELARLYGEIVNGRPPRCFLAGTLSRGPFTEDRGEFWRRRLEGVQTLALGQPRDLEVGGFASTPLQLNSETLTELKEFAGGQSVTLFMVLLTALKWVLARESHQHDLCISSPLANRDDPEWSSTVGMLARVVPFRTKFASDVKFGEALQQVASTVSETLKHASSVETAQHSGAGSTSVQFAFQNHLRTSVYEFGSSVNAVPIEERTPGSKFRLTLYLAERNGMLTGSWQFHTSSFSVDRVQEISEEFLGLLCSLPGMANEPRLSSSVLDLLRTVDSVAVIARTTVTTYAELQRRSDNVAAYLCQQGVQADDLVALRLPRSVDFLVAVLGVWKCGAAFLPLSVDHPEQRTDFLLREFGASMLVDACASGTFSNRHPWARVARHEGTDYRSGRGRLAYVMPTSGSTGHPKGVEISQANLAFYLPTLARRLEIAEGDRYLHTAAFTFSSSVRQWLLPLICGATVVLTDEETRRDPERLARFLTDQDVSVLDLVPTHWRALTEHGISNSGKVRLALSASEPLSADIVTDIQKAFPQADVVAMYGQTETTGIVSTVKLEPAHLQDTFAPLGIPLPGLKFDVPETGELRVEGPTVGLGYVGGQRFENCFPTGDQVSRDHRGLYQFKGRLDRQLKVLGHRVDPSEVEAALTGFPGVSGAAVLMKERRLHGILEVAEQCEEKSVREFLAERLPRYMIPGTFTFVSDLPRTDSGKLARAHLEESDKERVLCRVWSEVLKLPVVEPEDNFFHLGGDSLLSLEIISKARDAGIPMTLDQLFQFQTVRKICALHTRANGRSRQSDELHGRLDREKLREFCILALTQAGLEPTGAEALCEVQLDSSMRGLPTHNVADIPRYVERLKQNILNPRPRIETLRESTTMAVLTGDNGPGQWIATLAMQKALEMARGQGLGLVLVRESNHFGAAGFYARLAARQGLIGIVTTNGPNILAPTGGVTPLLGNNPIAVAIPRGELPPLVLDIALSVAPRGKIGLRVQEGQPLEPGWILDALGQPTTELEDLAAGLGVPIGDHKGYGLALMMEILAGVLSGAEFGLGHSRSRLKEAENPANIGHFFLVLDPECVAKSTEFQERLRRLVEQISSSQKARGVERIYLPGEKEWESWAESQTLGVPMRWSSYELLQAFATREALSERLPEFQTVQQL